MDEQNNDNEIKKMLEIAKKMLEMISLLKETCKDCEKCEEFKKISEKTTVLLSKIIFMQAKDIQTLETLLNDVITEMEMSYKTQINPKNLH